jgi:hypothetical protein
MFVSKRRPASTRAVSRKVEGTEPRNTRNRKDDEIKPSEVNTSTAATGKEVFASSGSETMARVTLRQMATREALLLLSKDDAGEYAKQPQKGREAKSAAGSRIV